MFFNVAVPFYIPCQQCWNWLFKTNMPNILSIVLRVFHCRMSPFSHQVSCVLYIYFPLYPECYFFSSVRKNRTNIKTLVVHVYSGWSLQFSAKLWYIQGFFWNESFPNLNLTLLTSFSLFEWIKFLTFLTFS